MDWIAVFFITLVVGLFCGFIVGRMTGVRKGYMRAYEQMRTAVKHDAS